MRAFTLRDFEKAITHIMGYDIKERISEKDQKAVLEFLRECDVWLRYSKNQDCGMVNRDWYLYNRMAMKSDLCDDQIMLERDSSNLSKGPKVFGIYTVRDDTTKQKDPIIEDVYRPFTLEDFEEAISIILQYGMGKARTKADQEGLLAYLREKDLWIAISIDRYDGFKNGDGYLSPRIIISATAKHNEILINQDKHYDGGLALIGKHIVCDDPVKVEEDYSITAVTSSKSFLISGEPPGFINSELAGDGLCGGSDSSISVIEPLTVDDFEKAANATRGLSLRDYTSSALRPCFVVNKTMYNLVCDSKSIIDHKYDIWNVIYYPENIYEYYTYDILKDIGDDEIVCWSNSENTGVKWSRSKGIIDSVQGTLSKSTKKHIEQLMNTTSMEIQCYDGTLIKIPEPPEGDWKLVEEKVFDWEYPRTHTLIHDESDILCCSLPKDPSLTFNVVHLEGKMLLKEYINRLVVGENNPKVLSYKKWRRAYKCNSIVILDSYSDLGEFMNDTPELSGIEWPKRRPERVIQESSND